MKNLSFASLLLRLPVRLPLDFLAFSMEVLKGHFTNALAVAKAYIWVLFHLGLILRKRREVQKLRREAEKTVLQRMYPGSIVFEYFLLKRRSFSKLIFIEKFLAGNRIIRSDRSVNRRAIKKVVK